jgi:oligosaccharide repeat unit polymerase
MSGTVLTIAYVTNFYMSGAANALKAPVVDRGEVLTTLETGKIWLLTYAMLVWLMVCVLLWISKNASRSIRPLHICSAIIIALGFLTVYARLRNRRELMMALMFVCVLLLFKRRRKVVVALLIASVVLGLFVGVTRSMNLGQEGEVEALTFSENMFSEAIFPNYPLISEIGSHRELEWGASYLRVLGTIPPTFGLWTKPLSLSLKFELEYANNTMGYAYTPLGEGYANFGGAAAFMIPFVLVLSEHMLLRGAVAAGHRKGAFLFPLIFLSLPWDINRGEFAAILTELVLFAALAWCYLKICSLNIRRQV